MRTGLHARHLLAVAAVVVALAWPVRARAQCPSSASSCTTCHEVQRTYPVLQGPLPWHLDHAYGDYCAACHGGDRSAPTAFAAHATLAPPLAAPRATCGACHDDPDALAERYLAVAVSSRLGGPAAPVEDAAPGAAPPRWPVIDQVLAGLAVGLAGVIGLLARRARAQALGGARALRARLGAPTIRPLVAGALLGGVVAISEIVFRRPLAASGAVDKLAAYAGRELMPDSPYYRHVMTPGVSWQVWLIIGVLAGAFASARLAGEARWRWLPDTQWAPRFGARVSTRLALAFAGAVLVQIGAGIAGGCTSGLAISGGAVLAPGAFLFMAGMFAGGIPAAWLLYRARSPEVP